jgi:hypothetical protein
MSIVELGRLLVKASTVHVRCVAFIATTLVLHVPVLAADHTLELAGILAIGGSDGAVIVVGEARGDERSSWLKIGQEWRNYRVISIDVLASAATLRRDGKDIVLSIRGSRVENSNVPSVILPVLVSGSQSLKEGRLVYSSDAVVQFGDLRVSTHTGNMYSDGTSILGDLTVERDTHIMFASDGKVTSKNGKPSFSAKRLSYRNKNAEPPMSAKK